MENNHVEVSAGFRVLLGSLAPYIARELGSELGAGWWTDGVLGVLYSDQKKDLPASGDWAALVDSLDIYRCLVLIGVQWKVFRKKLTIDHRTWSTELVGVRNKLAHLGSGDFSADDAWRALDTMSRLCEAVDPEGAEELRELLQKFKGASTEAPAEPSVSGMLNDIAINGLPGWRECIEPHPDVAQGRYKNAEFAADLAQVARGEGAFEYADPVEFFARTYVTEGMSGLLEQSMKRLCGKDGEPVIQLKTAFGGGKTHSMLALYHALRGAVPIGKIPVIKPVLQRAGLSALPKANVAVLVGTAIDPSRSKRPFNLPGVTVNTLWGEMAAQLAVSAGKPELYDIVRESDKKGVSPGSEALKNLFDAASPCLVLMDEIVAYAKKISGASGLPAGTFDNFVSFIQEVTEAAKASKNSIVVASIPESEAEVGGGAGKAALEAIEHTFGRMESIWKPVAASEGFEIVRRRLFLDCKNPEGRDAVCSKFSQMYKASADGYPVEAKEMEYRNRMIACYPIHPEVFDRLYEDWATLERFQKTRGVLRLMAAVIHELWAQSDASLMIMPGSFPLDVPAVRDELTRHLPDGWNALVDREVDGKNSMPWRKDQAIQRYGARMAARRVARAVMLGSAPTVRAQKVRGIEAARIRLGVIQPGENAANFIDALGTLETSLAYLYASGARYWYDTRPTLRKTVEDRAAQTSMFEVEEEIESRLMKLKKEKPFEGLHSCPSSSNGVPDERSARLVILRPCDMHDKSAMTAAIDILCNKGSVPRVFRNTLSFLAPDEGLMNSLNQAVRLHLAWQSIDKDKEALNLDAAQNNETKENLKKSFETVEARIKEAYCWLLVPRVDKSGDLKETLWEAARIIPGNEGIVLKAAKKMTESDEIITKWSQDLLLMELDGLLWKGSDHIGIKKLWECLCSYCYLPRLANAGVLDDAIKQGVSAGSFAYASGISGERYEGLAIGQQVGAIDHEGYLVKSGAALKQLETQSPDPPKPEPALPALATEKAPKRRFHMSADLANPNDVKMYMDEIIEHLSLGGAKVSISIEALAASGFSQQLIRAVSENCQALHVPEFNFEEQ